MYLKRLYATASPGELPAVRGIRVLRATRVQHFTPSFIDDALVEGWLAIGGGVITIMGEKGPVRYRIARPPGAYCCHCEARVGGPEAQRPGDDGLTDGQRHVRDAHAGAASPDPLCPAGYRLDRHFTATLIGAEVDAMSQEEATAMERGVRQALHGKLRAKYGDTRRAAEQRRAAKQAAGGEVGHG